MKKIANIILAGVIFLFFVCLIVIIFSALSGIAVNAN
jgi:hypothetical protein